MTKKSKRVPVDVGDPPVLSIEETAVIVNDKPGITIEATPVELGIVRVEYPSHGETIDLSPIYAAAEKAGLSVSSLAILDGQISVRCGPHVPAFEAADVPSLVALISSYNCKHCGTGGGHHPNCGRPR